MRRTFWALVSCVVVLMIWIIISIFAHIVAADVVRILAFNVTNSYAFPDCRECLKFTWDRDLQIASYSLYIVIFGAITTALMYINKRWKESQVIKYISLLIFSMSFPTHTVWGVATYCDEPPGCAWGMGSGSYINLVVPSILSINPISIILSSFIAYKIACYYRERIEFSHA